MPNPVCDLMSPLHATPRAPRVDASFDTGLLVALLLAVATLALPVNAAEAFVPAGSKAQLSVEWRFESAGKRQNRVDLFEWRGLRSAKFTVPLVAQPPREWSAMQAPDANQQAKLANAQKTAAKAADTMAPMMASVQQIMARCGEDEACIERETTKLGFSMSGSPQVEQGRKAVNDVVAATRPGAPRFQVWQGEAVSGSYEVDEFMHVVHGDPICMSLPRQRCTRDESRRGQGPLVASPNEKQGGMVGLTQLEFDAAQGRLLLRLPNWMVAPVKDGVRTDEPQGTHSTDGLVWLKSPSFDADALRDVLAYAQPLAGPVRGAAGERTLAIAGADGAGGKLTVRWKIEAR